MSCLLEVIISATEIRNKDPFRQDFRCTQLTFLFCSFFPFLEILRFREQCAKMTWGKQILVPQCLGILPYIRKGISLLLRYSAHIWGLGNLVKATLSWGCMGDYSSSLQQVQSSYCIIVVCLGPICPWGTTSIKEIWRNLFVISPFLMRNLCLFSKADNFWSGLLSSEVNSIQEQNSFLLNILMISDTLCYATVCHVFYNSPFLH